MNFRLKKFKFSNKLLSSVKIFYPNILVRKRLGCDCLQHRHAMLLLQRHFRHRMDIQYLLYYIWWETHENLLDMTNEVASILCRNLKSQDSCDISHAPRLQDGTKLRYFHYNPCITVRFNLHVYCKGKNITWTKHKQK